VADSGGNCVCPASSKDNCITDSPLEYLQCVELVKRDLVTATAAIAALSSFCMGLFANLPIALAPGMGLNAYFAYTVVGFHGNGTSYRTRPASPLVDLLYWARANMHAWSRVTTKTSWRTALLTNIG
jgi:xanthine/uracil/vitamin C permease (AzgA family)